MKSDRDHIKIILKEISVKDAKSFYRLYVGVEPNIQAQTTEKKFILDVSFASGKISLSEFQNQLKLINK